MIFAELNTLLDYNYWARDRLLEAVTALTLEQFTRPLGSSFSSVRDTLAHICDAESIWLARWSGRPPEGFQPPNRIPDVEAARREWTEIEAAMRSVVGNLGPEGIERVVAYKDFRGNPRSHIFGHMVQHVVNHGSYHRGQVTTMLRQLGAQPAKSMDLIAFYQERQQPKA
jgi:uncharacterized damage-inducible protein DinB